VKTPTVPFSIVVPCHNEVAVIERKLDNCVPLVDPGQAELIVVDDLSTDDTVSRVHAWLARHAGSAGASAVRLLVNRDRPGKNGALRIALRDAAGEILLITDADILLDADVLTKASKYFERDALIGALCLTPRISSDSSRTASRYVQHYENFNRRLKMLQSRLDSVPTLHGQAMFIRASMQVTPHDSLPADDVDFALQVRVAGGRVRYAADVPFYETISSEERSVFRQKVRRAKAVMRSLWHYRRLLLNPRYGWFGFVCYPADFALYFLLAPALSVALLVTLWWVVVHYGAAGALFAAGALAVCALVRPVARVLRFIAILLTSQFGILMETGPRIRWMTNRQT
jgi:cellulose synthase/poly-beta-1,6-N-acetylglucosamine synthase-like glycosyltransferase